MKRDDEQVYEKALLKRHEQGWLDVYSASLDDIVRWIREYRKSKKTVSIGYLGNVVDLWLVPLQVNNPLGFRERLADEEELLVELGSDQTSLHNPYLGGYYPVGLSVDEANSMMTADPDKFKQLVQERSPLPHVPLTLPVQSPPSYSGNRSSGLSWNVFLGLR